MNAHGFINRIRSLHNIDGFDLPGLDDARAEVCRGSRALLHPLRRRHCRNHLARGRGAAAASGKGSGMMTCREAVEREQREARQLVAWGQRLAMAEQLIDEGNHLGALSVIGGRYFAEHQAWLAQLAARRNGAAA
jgi:hypothetical protein